LSLTLGFAGKNVAANVAPQNGALSGVAKPVVLTGAMRPATATEPDGPANLLFAVRTAAAWNRNAMDVSSSLWPVSVAFAGKVMDARTVQKVHANRLDAFADVRTPDVRTPDVPADFEQARNLLPYFDFESLNNLPKVQILYFNAEADAELVRFAAERSAGLVVAGAGAGEFSCAWKDALLKVNVPVVVSTRINCGSVVPEQLLVPGTIAAYGLPPAKAAVLLRLALTVTNNPEKIQTFFKFLYYIK